MCDLMSSSTSYAQAQTLANSINLSMLNPKTSKLLADYKQIILELRAQNFDVIRFATYRTASKLRFIQKRLNLHLIDLWNVIETFRDNNLHTLDLLHELETSKLETCIQNMYVQLNKRLAFNQHINVETQTQLLLAWLLNLYDKNKLARIKVFSIKIALTSMCAGKLVDKLKYIFNQISDQSKNTLIVSKFELYLKELLILPKSVFEEPSFGYNENISKTCFDLNSAIRLEDFLSVALSDVGPPCFIWLNIFHRFTIVQNVTHPVKCSACERSNFNGFRYKCQKCRKYQLCQDCFWRGRISHSHQLTHQMKEYTSYKSAAKQLSNSLKRSFFCKPNKHATNQPLQPVQKQQQQSQLQKATQPSNTRSAHLNQNTNTMPSTSTSLNYNNNSDYNMLFRNKEKSSLEATKLQAQTLNNINSNMTYTLPATTSFPTNSHDIYASLSKSSPKAKKVFQQLSLSSNIEENFFNESSKMIKQPIDLTHIVPAVDCKQVQSINQASSSLTRPSNQSYTNTLSMTRSKNSDNLNYNSSNLFASFLLSNNNLMNIATQSSSSNILNNDEHNLISNYCSRLADFYVKNPHLSSSPTSNVPLQQTNTHLPHSSASSSKLSKTHTKAKTSFQCSDLTSQSMTPIATNNVNRTASLSRHLWSNSSNKQNQYATNTISTTTNLNKKNDNYNCVQVEASNAKDSKSNSYAIRSLSETNFRKSSNEIGSLNDLNNIDDRLLKEKREIVAKLEKQNREIIKEIKRLRLKQMSNRSLDQTDTFEQQQQQQMMPQRFEQQQQISHSSVKNQQISTKPKESTKKNNLADSNSIYAKSSLKQSVCFQNAAASNSNTALVINPEIIAELQTLRHKKGELDNRMQMLETSRDELVGRLTQLDSLIGCQSVKQQQQEQLQRIISSNNLNSSPSTSPRCQANSNKKFSNAQQNIYAKLSDFALNNINLPMQQMNDQSSSTFVPIVSASMAMQMPLMQSQQQNNCHQLQNSNYQQQSQSQGQHQHRTGIITNLTASQQQPAQVQQRSWSQPSTPAMYEFHPTRLANTNLTMQHNQQLPQQQLQQQQLNAKHQIASSLAPSTSSLLSLTASCISNGSSNNTNNHLAMSDHTRILRNDLLIAADSVTNAMQNLVKELNSENESCNSNTSDDEEDVEENFNCESKFLNHRNQNKHVPSYSASVTPVTFRKNIYNSNQQQMTNTSRNGLNLDECNLENSHLRNIESQLNHKQMHNGDSQIYGEQENQAENAENDFDEDDMMYENYLMAESFIDDLNNKNNIGLYQQCQFPQEQLSNLADNSEQVACWRRELEQILIEDQSNNIYCKENESNSNQNGHSNT